MYNNPGFPTQRTVNSNIDNGKQQINLDYIKRQSKIIKSQNQPYQGHIPNHINPVPNDNLIQQTRWNIDAPSTRYNTNKLDRTRESGKSKKDEDLEASEIFTGPNQNYDPYIDFLNKKGLLNDNYKSRINTKYINIDSRGRRADPTITKEGEIQLESNPMFYSSLTVNSVISGNEESLLNINIPNHNFKINDKIIISNVASEIYSVRALYDDKNSGSLTQDIDKNDYYYYTVIFQENSSSLIIKTDFDTSIYFNDQTNSYNIDNNEIIKNQFQSFNPNFRVGDGISFLTLSDYDTSNMFVTLSGFIGDSIGNIPVNFLNSTHRVHFINPDGTNNIYINVPDGLGNIDKITGFYIELPFPFHSSTSVPLPSDLYKDMIIDINFRYIGGIAINAINSDIPISSENINGFQTIVSITKNTISIRLNKDTYYIEPTPESQPEIGEQPIYFGGDNIFISKITEITGGYNNPNNYIIELPETIHNVFMVKLVDTIFPKTTRVFQKQKNNKIYWQNLSDGDIIYNTEINEGSYTTEELKIELEKQMYSVTRTNIPEKSDKEYNYNEVGIDQDLSKHLIDCLSKIYDKESKYPAINKGGYTNKVRFDITIDNATSIVTFQSYKQANLRRPIIKVVDLNGNTPVTDSSDLLFDCYEPPFTIKIVHPQHGLKIGDTILLSDFIETLGIPAETLNQMQTISNISSDDTYEIIIDNVNLTSSRHNTYGGYNAKIFVPNIFRLLFNKNDTMGVQLGFRNVGSNLSITNYGIVISNQQSYQNEVVTVDKETNIKYVKDSIGNQIVLTNNSLQFRGNNYIYLVIREFSGCTNISQDKQLIDYFAKINLSEKSEDNTYNTFVYNTFSHAPVTFYDMIDLQQISIQIYGSDGQLYNFYGVDHSFKLEITTLDLLPQETGINSTNNFV
jgi:hypothetical protein